MVLNDTLNFHLVDLSLVSRNTSAYNKKNKNFIVILYFYIFSPLEQLDQQNLIPNFLDLMLGVYLYNSSL